MSPNGHFYKVFKTLTDFSFTIYVCLDLGEGDGVGGAGEPEGGHVLGPEGGGQLRGEGGDDGVPAILARLCS